MDQNEKDEEGGIHLLKKGIEDWNEASGNDWGAWAFESLKRILVILTWGDEL